jgi:TP901 family phage tail tape measure protein
MAEFLPPVVVQLLADAKEFKTQMGEAGASLDHLGKKGDSLGVKMGALGSKIATGYLTVIGGALIYGTKLAFDYQESIHTIGLQSGASEVELDRLKTQILQVSSATATSTKDISDAYLEAEKAGLRKAKADEVVTDAAKAAKITGSDVVTITKSLIAVQELQTARGMSTAQVTDLLVNANKAHLGSMDNLVAALQGRVGAAFALHNVGLRESFVLTDELSKAGYTNSRSMVSFASALGKATAPTKAQALAMKALHVDSEKVAKMLTKPDGVIQAVQYLGQVSKQTSESSGSLATAVFGSAGAGAAGALIANATNLAKSYSTLAGSGKDLNSSFQAFLKTPAGQMQVLQTNLKNALTGLGIKILPAVTDIVQWVNGFIGEIKKNKWLSDLLSGAALGLAGLAVASKITKAFDALKGLFGASQQATQTKLLAEIARNTLVVAEEGGTGKGKGIFGKVGDAVKGAFGWISGALAPVLKRVPVLGSFSLGELGGAGAVGASLYPIFKRWVDSIANGIIGNRSSLNSGGLAIGGSRTGGGTVRVHLT